MLFRSFIKNRFGRRGIYWLPNLFTLAALFSGFYAIVQAMNERFEFAAIGIFAAMVLDGQADIGAADVPQLLVFNKMDALPAERLPQRLQDDYEIDGRPVPRIFVSAANGAGLSALREALSQRALAGVAAYDLEERLAGDGHRSRWGWNG